MLVSAARLPPVNHAPAQEETALLSGRHGERLGQTGTRRLTAVPGDMCCCTGARGHGKLPWVPWRWQEPVQALISAGWHSRNQASSHQLLLAALRDQTACYCFCFQSVPV